ncbi:tetratricopeptide repeat protein [Moheibacter sediminis]|uniref:Tetratricopeptide repeat-containing protein n=1 Tax=Moheibacter sediminis TaxID=1434700 RepID=A0A1W1Y802_9FLAO|nr:tetratricopeptide repeat protein [Moheibacter sediminis]SMC32283.1 Tetratricopeptide repeat-containing protein [Moheibacter sediminis]
MKFKFKTYNFILFLGLIFSQISFAQKVSDEEYNAATLNVYDDPDKTIEVGIRMFETSRDKPKRQINALLLLSNAYSSKREYEKSLDYAIKARELSKKSNDARSEIAVLNKIAAQYHQLGINDKALQYLDESDQIIATYPYQDSVQMVIGNNHGVRGFIYRDQLSCDIAIDYFNRSINQYKKDMGNNKTLANMSVVTYNKGNCFVTLGQMDSAKITLQQSLNLAIRAEAKSLEAFSRKGLAEVYTLQGNYNDAISELNKALEISKNVGDLVLNQGIYKGFADNYLAINNWEEYQKYYDKYLETEAQNKTEERKTISVSLAKHSEEIKSEIKDLEIKFGIGFFVLIVVILAMIVLIIFGQIRFQKQFNALKSQLKFSQRD